ncbi:MAG TPA: GntR family transcriptional regulator [Chloroflexota bacterium]
MASPAAAFPRQYSTLREWAYLRLRDMIVTGALPPGADLHESQLCAHLGISKSPLREALRQLAQDGLVVAESNKGSLVAPLTFDDFREIYSLRRHIEPLEVRLATPRIDAATVADLRANIEALEGCMRSGDNPGFAERDVEFHLILARTSGHRRLLRIQESLQAEMMRLVILRVAQSGMRTETAAEHSAIVDALEARDPDAAAGRMLDHLERAEEWRRRALEERLDGRSAATAPRTEPASA